MLSSRAVVITDSSENTWEVVVCSVGPGRMHGASKLTTVRPRVVF